MRKEDLHILALLEFRPSLGKIFCEDERMLVCTASSAGALQSILIDRFGVDEARRVLCRLGYSHGFHSCLTAEHLFGKEQTSSPVATRFHEVVGFGKYEDVIATEPPSFCFRAEYHGSVEVEQFLSSFGESSVPVCWWSTGFASGYCSARFGLEAYYQEVRCASQGFPVCEVLGQEADQWGDKLPGLRADYGFTSAEQAAEFRGQQYELHRKWQVQRAQTRENLVEDSSPRENSVRHRLVEVADESGFIVREEPMWEALEHALYVAKLDTPVLVHGETGTGKEFVINLIHNQSARACKPLVSINCAALTETLLESELFGHVRGAFTGAISDKPGLFEVASQGTLFLDEIGEMPPIVQAKLLRVLENGEMRRVGSTKTTRVSPRILAATHRDLQTLVEEEEFRSDLYFRLNSFVIDLPPLRERLDSIPALVQSFVQQISKSFGKSVEAVSPEAMSKLVGYSWPGNVRELKHAIERAVVVARNKSIEVQDLPPEISKSSRKHCHPTSDDWSRFTNLKDGERQIIVNTLAANGGNRAATARALKIDVSTLWRKICRYGIH